MTIRDLHVSAGSRELVASYSDMFPAGTFVWLRGPNGSGKSTFLAALEAELRGGWAVVGWVHPGMGLPPGYRVGMWRRCLARGGAGSPPILAGSLGAKLPFRELSTGEQRLLLMEGVMALPRDVLLMDEALEHLAPERRHDVVEALRARGGTAVTWLASHVPPMTAEQLPAATRTLTLDGQGGHLVDRHDSAHPLEPASPGIHPADPVSSASGGFQARRVVTGNLRGTSLLKLELQSWWTARVTLGWVGGLTALLVLGEILHLRGLLASGEELRWAGFVILVGLPWGYGFGVTRDRECGFLSYCLANLSSPVRYLRVRLLSAVFRVMGLLLLVGLVAACLAWIRGGDGWRVAAQMGSWGCILLFLLPVLLGLEVVGRARFPTVALALFYVGAGLLLVAMGKDVDLLRVAMGVDDGLPDRPDQSLLSRAAGGAFVAWLSIPVLAKGLRPARG
ncbi:MAG: ABC transporter ATP-binding protein [Gemmatimonadota bacterium]